MFGLSLIKTQSLDRLEQGFNFQAKQSENLRSMLSQKNETVNDLCEKIEEKDKKYNTLSLKLARKCLRIKQLNIKIQRLSKGRSKRSLRKLKVVY